MKRKTLPELGDFDKVFFIVLFLPYEDEGIGAGELF